MQIFSRFLKMRLLPKQGKSVVLVLIFAAAGCQQHAAIDIGRGVSREIATYRAASLADIRYDLTFRIPDSLSSPILGTAEIAFRLTDVSQPLILDFVAPADNIRELRLGGEAVAYNAASGHIVIAKERLRKGANRLRLDFIAGEGSLNRTGSFLYTLFVPDRASFAFPCFDQPDLKAKYKLTLEIPPQWIAVANGNLIRQQRENGRVRCEFAETALLPTYLFSFAAGEFEVVEEQRHGIRMKMYHRETDRAKVARNRKTIFDLHAAALRWLENYTGIPYPFGKFAFVLIPSFQYNGMEHPGAILYRASSLFLEESATQNQLLGRASLIAHETTHMWFGDLVTMAWFNDVWMKEVFANFMAAKIVNPSFPEIDHELRFLLAHHPGAYAVDRSAGANPIRQQLENLQQAGTLYGAIIYQKAPIIMRQLEALLGADTFQAGLQEYLRRYSFGNATWPDLIAILDRKTPEDLAAWSRAWVNEPGMPIVQTNYTLAANGAIARCELDQEDPAQQGRLWQQNFTLRYQRGSRSERVPIQFRKPKQRIPELEGVPKPDFLLANADGRGYGYFALDAVSRAYLLEHAATLQPAVLRGQILLTLWEELLRFRITRSEFISTVMDYLENESDAQITQRALNDLVQVFWKFHLPREREKLAPTLERVLWQHMRRARSKAQKSAIFRAYRSIALTQQGVGTLEKIWRQDQRIPGLPLAESDYTTLAFELAVREPEKAGMILRRQLERMTNPDRRARLTFIMPALAADQHTRDAFFASLRNDANRLREAWVITALRYLHHPLRARESEKYIRPALDLLEEIQRTGDIFFPKRWLDAILSGHNSDRAAETVKTFLDAHPDYPARLKGKILQSADMLFRAANVLHKWERMD